MLVWPTWMGIRLDEARYWVWERFQSFLEGAGEMPLFWGVFGNIGTLKGAPGVMDVHHVFP